MKRLVLAVLSCLLALPLVAQESNVALFAVDYDLDSDTDVYPVLLGQNGTPYGAPIPGNGCTLSTSGSSTTVEASATTCFTDNGPLVAGDVVVMQIPGSVTYRVIDTVTDGDTIVVNEAVTLASPTVWSWLDFSAGAAVTDGWISVGNVSQVTMCVEYNQGDLATGVDFRWECKVGALGAQPVQVYPDNSAAAAVTTKTTALIGVNARTCIIIDVGGFSACRTAMNRNGADASDATTNREKISAYLARTFFAR